METIATRRLVLRKGNETTDVLVHIGRPVQEEKAWRCDFQIDGLDDDEIHATWGVDGIQAMSLCLKHIGIYLESREEAKEGRLTFGKGTDLGFPNFRIPSSPNDQDPFS
jgi:hypothetical protein